MSRPPQPKPWSCNGRERSPKPLCRETREPFWRRIRDSGRVYAAGGRVFEHPKAHTVPWHGGTIARSVSRPPQPKPRSYNRAAEPPRPGSWPRVRLAQGFERVGTRAGAGVRASGGCPDTVWWWSTRPIADLTTSADAERKNPGLSSAPLAASSAGRAENRTSPGSRRIRCIGSRLATKLQWNLTF